MRNFFRSLLISLAISAAFSAVLLAKTPSREGTPRQENFREELTRIWDLMDSGLPYPPLCTVSEDVIEPEEEILRRTDVITYTVQHGDTVWSIARKFGLDVNTLRWANPAIERNPDRLSPRQVLVILPVRGVYYKVKKGDTIRKIAKKFGVRPQAIETFPGNHLELPFVLQPGQKLIIPGGRLHLYTPPRPTPVPGYKFMWPAIGPITQGYWEKHHAIDIGLPYGSPVYASRAGRVIYLGWEKSGYGYLLILEHPDGMRTYYAHLSSYWVHEGDHVRQGQLIGSSGSTGNSTGPHLHFEIRKGRYIHLNPLKYLPPRK